MRVWCLLLFMYYAPGTNFTRADAVCHVSPRSACSCSTHFPPVLWSQRKGSIRVTVPLYHAQQLSFAFSNSDVTRAAEFHFSCLGCVLSLRPRFCDFCGQAPER